MSKYKKSLQISIPQAYDIGFCPVNQTSQFPFTIFNPNLKLVSYNFKFTQFIVSPSQGALMPNTLNSFKIEFTPKQANVIVGTIILESDAGEQRVFRLSAVGKYPYLSINSNQVDFGDVLVTKQVSKEILLKNNSQVPAAFRIESHLSNEQFNDNFYTFYPNRGFVPPKMTYSVKVNYQPKFVDFKTITNAKMICESGNQVKLNLKGHSKKFNVNFNAHSINFGEIKLDSTLNKVITITNNSELDTEFEFYTDSDNIFSFNEAKGVVHRNSYKKIIIEFRPRNTISYYERVYCIVRNHLLLYVDLIGTCFDLLIKPVPLLQVHIDSFRKRVIEGRISQIELKYIENNILLKLAKRGQEQDNNLVTKGEENFYQTTNLIKEHPYVLQKQLFLENTINQLINVSQDNIQFGFCDVMTLSGQREIQVVNKLQTKLNIYWINQKKQTLNGQYMTVFNIYPETAVLKPNMPAKFTITFRPLKSNTYYFQNVQFFAIKSSSKISKKTLEQFEYKQLRSSPQATLLRNVKLSQTIQQKVKESVESTQVFPPLSGVVRCVGHSFTPSTMPFIPIMKILPSNKITMKPTLLNTSVYDSFELVNQSDTPIYYRMGQDINKVFKFFPKIGLIQPKSFAIIAVEFTPTEYKIYNSIVSVHLNDMPGANAKIVLVGACTSPQIELQNEGKIFFAPTFTGVYTSRKYKIKNLSKTNVRYMIEIPQKYSEQVYFQPNSKELDPNETFELSCYFTPRQKRAYKIKLPITVYQATSLLNLKIGYHNPGSSSVNAINEDHEFQPLTKQFWLQLIGQGSDGNLKLSHEELNFNTVKITEQKKMNFKIINTADCAFFVDIALKNDDFQCQFPSTQNQLNNAFFLSFKEGTIPANSEIDVNINFSPTQVANFNLKLIVNAKQKAPKKVSMIKIKNTEPSSKCQMKIKAKGNYPLLEIIDIRNDTLSVAALWENFQIQKINNQLSCKLDSEEKRYLSVENLTFAETKNLEENLKHYQWNLGYVSTKIKAKPRKVIITVKNYGGTPLDYSFKFPSDNKVKEELWADPGEPTEEQSYEKAILEKNIFQIKPKIATLQPGQVKDIQLVYSPASLQFNKTSGGNQIHKLKVVFQIQNGKSLVFNLKGTTLGPNEGLITVKKSHYQLPQAQIGLLQPIKFPIQINNVGSIKTNYKTQIIYQEDQYPDVLKIENPSHFLLPGENLYLYCLYKPLQRKIYNFKVIIHVYDFNKEIQKINLDLTGNMLKKKNLSKKEEKIIPFQRSMVSQIGSKVFFSIEQINFQKMLSNFTKYKVILLYNMSHQHSLNFQFPTQNQVNLAKQGLTCQDKFIIQPSSGILEPNSFVELKITLISSKSPSFYEGQIPCNILWAENRFSSEDLETTQKQMTLSSTRQTLFLRVKKQSILDQKSLMKKSTSKPVWSKKTLMQNIFENIIENTLNDPEIDDLIGKIQDQETELICQMDSNNPASVDLLNLNHPQNPFRGIDQQQNLIDEKKDYSNHEYLILNEQFKDITEIVMENTFFNIIQETTHEENDFLRVGKKFIQAEKI